MVAIAGAAFGGFSKFFQAGGNSGGYSSSFFSFPTTNSFGRGNLIIFRNLLIVTLFLNTYVSINPEIFKNNIF